MGSRKFTGAHFTTLVETLADLKVHKVDELAAAIHAAVKKDKTPQSELPAIRKLLSNRFAHIRIALKDTRLELVRVEKGVFQIRRRKPRKAE